MHYLIIGASAAGISAAENLRRLDPDCRITVLSKEKEIAYSRCLTTYYISGQISREQLFIREPDEIAALNIELHTAVEVVSVNPLAKSVKLADGTEIGYDRLLIASGASPLMPDIPGIKGQGVFTLRTISDAETISGYLKKASSAVILGDGLVSITAALALNSKGLKVSIVGIAPHILATFLDARAAQILQQKLNDLGIDLYLQRSIKEIDRVTSGEISAAALTDGTRIPAEMILVAVGVTPNTGFLDGRKAGLPVNEYLETAFSEIYAAGDAAVIPDPVRGNPTWNPLWPNAVEQGRLAAYNMAGRRRIYPGATNLNSLNLAGVSVICAGLANSDAPDIEPYVISDRELRYEKVVFCGNRLVGYILLGNTEKAGVLTSLIISQTLTPTQKVKILNGRYSYSALTGLNP